MTLLLTAQEAEGLLDVPLAIEATRTLVLEYLAGSTTQMVPFGGFGSNPPLPRVAAGVLYGLRRMNVRGGEIFLLFDLAERRIPLAIMNLDLLELRVAGSVGLAISTLARPDARTLCVIGSGNTALGAVKGAAAARSFQQVRVYSPHPEHRHAFAQRVQARDGLQASPCDTSEEAIAGADVVVIATNAHSPVLKADQLHPGTLLVAIGSDHEVDESVFLRADQVVATSRTQTLEAGGSGQGAYAGANQSPLAGLLANGRLATESILDLGTFVNGDREPRTGPLDLTVYLDSRGGVADAVLASVTYDRARSLGRGTELAFPSSASPA
jgi:alanine dehydrogenase